MSVDLMWQAMQVKDIRSSTKFLLVVLADWGADPGAWPTIEELRNITLQDEETIERGLAELEAADLIRIVSRNGRGRIELQVFP